MHVNEDIPGDSLAATGTRFQRQIRTDRVRPSGSRARASTGGSQSGHRGHGRNLSTSSIASTASNVSTVSTMSTMSHENGGHRPHSSNLLEQRRGGLTIDTLRASPTHNYTHTHQSGSGNSTPTSYYAATPSSPFRSNLASPITMSYNNSWTDRHVARRLSVPSGASVYQAGGPPLQFPNQYSINNSANSSIIGSPTASTFSTARSEVPSDDWRRRTWHPNTYSNYSYPRPATSGLSYSQTPNEPRPAFAPQALAAAGQTPKLPGIEAFDQMSSRPITPPPRMQPVTSNAITPGRLSIYPTIDRRQPGHGHQRGVHSWDMSLHQNLTRLDIAGDASPRESVVWVHQQQQLVDPISSLQSSPERPNTQAILPPGPSRPLQVPPQLILPSQPDLYVRSLAQNHPQNQESSPIRLEPQPNILTPPSSSTSSSSAIQRTGWSSGVPHKLMQRSMQPPGGPTNVDSGYGPTNYRDYQPQVVHANGYIESRPTATGPVSLEYSQIIEYC